MANGYIRQLRETISSLPSTINDGSVYFEKSTGLVYVDVGNQRYCINPQADWREIDEDAVSFIKNKPVIGTAAAYDIADGINETQDIPTSKMVYDAVQALLKETGLAMALAGNVKSANSQVGMADISAVYVYNGPTNQDLQNGCWYHYDEDSSEWVRGGTYRSQVFSTDKTLTIDGEAADAAVVGSRLRGIEDEHASLSKEFVTLNTRVDEISQRVYGIIDGTISYGQAASFIPHGNCAELWLTTDCNSYVGVSFDGGNTTEWKDIPSGVSTKFERQEGTPIGEVRIYSAGDIVSIDNLYEFLPSQIDFKILKKLKYIDVGSSEDGYSNSYLMGLDLSGLTKIERIDARNCTNLSGKVNLEDAVGIKEAYFDNTSVSGVDLFEYCPIRVLHLPSGVAEIRLLNFEQLEKFVVGSYSSVDTLILKGMSGTIKFGGYQDETLFISDSESDKSVSGQLGVSSSYVGEETVEFEDTDSGLIIDLEEVLSSVKRNCRIYVDWDRWVMPNAQSVDDFFSLLDSFRGVVLSRKDDGYAYLKDSRAVVRGTIWTYRISKSCVKTYALSYPNVAIETNVYETEVTFKTWDGGITIGTGLCLNGKFQGAPYEVPERASYEPIGWSKSRNSNVADCDFSGLFLDDIKIYAAYRIGTRTVSVVWKNIDGSILYADDDVRIGEIPQYEGETPTYKGVISYGWNPTIIAVDGDTVFVASYECYLIYASPDGLELKTVRCVDGIQTDSSPRNVTKHESERSRYIFAGWSTSPNSEIADFNIHSKVFTDTIVYAVFEEVPREYEVSWKNTDDTLLGTSIVQYGMVPKYSGGIPAYGGKRSSGWIPELSPVTGNVTYYAKYDKTAVVKFMDWDGSEYFTSISYTNGIPNEILNIVPEKEMDTKYVYEFSGWSAFPKSSEKTIGILENVTDDLIVYAAFTRNMRLYEITWQDYKGNILYIDWCAYGTIPVYDGVLPSYRGSIANGWSPSLGFVRGNMVYSAVHKSKRIYMTYNGEKTLAIVDYVNGIAQGEVPNNPVRKENLSDRYEFIGWSTRMDSTTADFDESLYGFSDVVLYASYDIVPITHKIQWLDMDGTLLKEEQCAYGTIPDYGGMPERNGVSAYAWDPLVDIVTGEQTYIAQYYAYITFRNYNGVELKKALCVNGRMLDDPPIPPVKPSTEHEDYTFIGWNESCDAHDADSNVLFDAISDKDVYAVFSKVPKLFLVTWKDSDGAILKEEYLSYGSIPDISGLPTIAMDWTPAIGPVTRDMVYVALHSGIIRFMSWDGKVLIGSVQCADNEITGDIPEGPSRMQDMSYEYLFIGWSYSMNSQSADFDSLSPGSGNAVVYAAYKAMPRKFRITFVNIDNSILREVTCSYGEIPSYSGQTPSWNGTSFSYWSPEILPATEDTAYEAVYRSAKTITFKTKEGTVLGKAKCLNGNIVSNEMIPNELDGYLIEGWSANILSGTPDSSALLNVTEDITVYAIIRRRVTITFVRSASDGGGVYETQELLAGEMPEYHGDEPTCEKDDGYERVFIGWYPDIIVARRDTVYIARFIRGMEYVVPYIEGDRDDSFYQDEIMHEVVEIVNSNEYAGKSTMVNAEFWRCSAIMNSGFANCSNLNVAEFHNCTDIGTSAFYNCANLTIVSFPQCYSIGRYAFALCMSLTEADFPKANEIWDSAFFKCTSLEDISLSKCFYIGPNVFSSCTSLKSINIPICEKIGSYAFYNCVSLSSIELPYCNYIGSSAFFNCINLMSLYLAGSTVCLLDNVQAFYSTPISNSTLTGSFGSIFVPESLYDSYVVESNWSAYHSRIVQY